MSMGNYQLVPVDKGSTEQWLKLAHYEFSFCFVLIICFFFL